MILSRVRAAQWYHHEFVLPDDAITSSYRPMMPSRVRAARWYHHEFVLPDDTITNLIYGTVYLISINSLCIWIKDNSYNELWFIYYGISKTTVPLSKRTRTVLHFSICILISTCEVSNITDRMVRAMGVGNIFIVLESWYKESLHLVHIRVIFE